MQNSLIAVSKTRDEFAMVSAFGKRTVLGTKRQGWQNTPGGAAEVLKLQEGLPVGDREGGLPGRAWCTGGTRRCAQERARVWGLEEEANGPLQSWGIMSQTKGTKEGT